ncbi:peptidase S8/S53 domain-containing protein [Lactarius quietus]|nr:peptidase S8/S53 domain-containing protein [Lactarius quietus]
MPLANFTTPLSLGAPPPNTTINLHIAPVPQYENALIDSLYEVSTPGDPKHVLFVILLHMTLYLNVPLLHRRYGAHLTKEQVAQLVAPHPDTLQLVNSWLNAITYRPPPSHVPVSRANEMLGASYQLFRPSGMNGTTILRTIGYALPAVLHNHVRTVVPTTCFASTHPLQQIPRKEPGTVPSNRDDEDEPLIMPSVLRSLYRTAAYVPAATHKNAIGVVGFSNHYPSPADLARFMSRCRADAIDATFTVVLINGGGYDPTHPTMIPRLNQNMQYAQAITYPTPHTFYSTVGRISFNAFGDNKPDPDDAFLTWLDHLIHLETISQTIGASYVHNGLVVLFPSGNSGVGASEACHANDGSGVQFIPEFPSSCLGLPWVTSVGGTMRRTLRSHGFARGRLLEPFPPSYLPNPAVPDYLQQLGNQHHGLNNSAGRGIPDLAAQAINYFIVDGNKAYELSGTSCATPTVAAIFSLLNDYLVSRGKKPLGFLNAWLYGLGVIGMNDIKSGSNPGCGTKDSRLSLSHYNGIMEER